MSCYLDFRNQYALSYDFFFPFSFLPSRESPLPHASLSNLFQQEHSPRITCIILNSFSCFRLASMGLADMMSPGDSKLPVPLKADGKEEGTPQPESKSKVFPFSSARGVGSASLKLPCSLFTGVGLHYFFFPLVSLLHAFILCTMFVVFFSFPTPFMVWIDLPGASWICIFVYGDDGVCIIRSSEKHADVSSGFEWP